MDKLKSWIRTHKKTATVIGAALVAGLVALIYWLWTRYRGSSAGTVSAQPAGMIYSPGSGGAGGGQAGGDTGGGTGADVASMIGQQTQTMMQGLSQMFQQLTQSQQAQMQAFQEMEQQNQQSIQQMMQAQQESLKSMLSALQPPAPQAPAVPQPPAGGTILNYNYKYAAPVSQIAGGTGGGMVYTETPEQMAEFARGGSRNVGGSYSMDFTNWKPEGAWTQVPAASPADSKFNLPGGGSITIKGYNQMSAAEKATALRRVGLM